MYSVAVAISWKTELGEPYMLTPLLLGSLVMERIGSEFFEITWAEAHPRLYSWISIQ